MDDERFEARPINEIGVNPEIAADLGAINQDYGKILVTCGANQMYFENLIGKRVADIQKSLKEIFNIPSDCQALVHGEEVDSEYVLCQGDWLEFIKEAGVKG
jgi:hypothetical protein